MKNDVVIVGGSWAGLAGAMQLARARRKVVIIDSGKPRNRFAHTSHGFLGQDGRTPEAIRTGFIAQVLRYPTARLVEDEAIHAQMSDDIFRVALATGEHIESSKLILATGIADEPPSIPGLPERWGKSVLHCPYCHGYEVAGERLGVLAVSELSFHQAMLIPDWSEHVTLFTNRSFTPSPEQLASLKERGVKIEHEPVVELCGPSPALSGVRLKDGRTIELDALFTGARTSMASPLAEQLGCTFEDGPAGSFLKTDEFKQTNIPGLFAAGDITRAFGNATLATADGVMAGMAAHRSIVFPDAH